MWNSGLKKPAARSRKPTNQNLSIDMPNRDIADNDEAMLRAVVLDLLHYPRRVFQDEQELDECLHGGFYNQDEQDCELCEVLSRCRWLSSNDDFVALDQKPTAHLLDALQFARDQIVANVLIHPHPERCRCEACSWLVIADACLDCTAPKH